MGTFKPRPRGSALAALVEQAVPTALPAAPPQRREGQGRAPRTVQVNFRASEDFAKIIADLAEREGGMRRMFARVLRQLGHEIPEADLNPPATKRIYD